MTTRLARIAFLSALILTLAVPVMAQGPMTLGRTPWQMLRNPIVSPVPNYGTHGNINYYNHAPAIPPANSASWGPAPNGSTIGFTPGSRLSQCWTQVDFTFFQTLVDIPAGTTLSTFTISFSNMDDGSRVTIFNSANLGGLVIPGSYVFLGGSGTTNLAPFVVAGETNRVVITQMDDCPTGNNLGSAVVNLNGTVVPPVPTFNLTTAAGAGTVAVSPTGTSCGPNCNTYTQNTQVTVLATPYPGYQFSGWNGACSGTGTCQVTMDANKFVSAIFTPSAFSFDSIPTLPQPSQCTPMMMTWGRPKTLPATPANYDGVHIWYAKPTGSQLNVTLSVANFGKQSVSVIPIGNPIPAGPGPLVADATGLAQTPSGFVFATSSMTFSGLSSSTTYAIIVKLENLSKPGHANPNDPVDSGRHYNLQVQGSNAIALDTLTRSLLEHSEVNWVVNHDGGSQLSLQFSKDTSLPVYMNSNPLAGDIQFVSPSATTSSVTIPPGDIASASGSNGIWRVITDIHDHHNIEKLSGTDRHIYLDSMSCRGLLTVVKNVVNNNGGQKVPSDFSITVTGNSVQPNATFNGSSSGTTVSLLPGSYSVDEAADSGYSRLFSPGCVGEIKAGETRTCTITNDDRPGTLTVIKNVINDNGGTRGPADFSISVTGGNVQPAGSFPGSATGTPVSLNAGNYSVDEAPNTAYSKSLGADCSGTIANGQSKTCVITNDDRPATLTIIKTVINDNGGAKTAADFSITVTGGNVQPAATFNGSATGTVITLNAGNYSVDEAADSGYFKNLGPGCSGTVGNGQSRTCTIVNNDRPGTLRVIKTVVNDSGLVKVPSDFTLTVTGTNVSPSGTFSGSATGTVVTLNAGNYSVSETPDWRYEMSLATDCSGTIANGETKTCTVTNDDRPSAIGRMTGGGSVFAGSDRVTHGMTLQCSPAGLPQNLEINWGKGQRFHMDGVVRVWCGDNPAIGPTPPAAGFDTMEGAGFGSYNGVAGATVSFVFTDAGEPGRNDTAAIVVRDVNGVVVLTVSGNLNNGNQQSHN